MVACPMSGYEVYYIFPVIPITKLYTLAVVKPADLRLRDGHAVSTAFSFRRLCVAPNTDLISLHLYR